MNLIYIPFVACHARKVAIEAISNPEIPTAICMMSSGAMPEMSLVYVLLF